jgi:hypothetical protein
MSEGDDETEMRRSSQGRTEQNRKERKKERRETNSIFQIALKFCYHRLVSRHFGFHLSKEEKKKIHTKKEKTKDEN